MWSNIAYTYANDFNNARCEWWAIYKRASIIYKQYDYSIYLRRRSYYIQDIKEVRVLSEAPFISYKYRKSGLSNYISSVRNNLGLSTMWFFVFLSNICIYYGTWELSDTHSGATRNSNHETYNFTGELKFGSIRCIFPGSVWWLVPDGIEILEWRHYNKRYRIYTLINSKIWW